jgi:addiction module HigA family antidote
MVNEFFPNYICLDPPGFVLEEKMQEMGLWPDELAEKMGVPEITVRQLFEAEIPMTPELAAKIEQATKMSAELMMSLETGYHEDLLEAAANPDKRVYRKGILLNPKKTKQTLKPKAVAKSQPRDHRFSVSLNAEELKRIKKYGTRRAVSEVIRELALKNL